MRYRMIGIDLDGTLLGRSGRASESDLAAIAAAQRAGTIVVPCTGRAWRESREVLAGLPIVDDHRMGVFVTGAAVSDLRTGKTLDIAVIEPHVAMQLVEHLFDLPEAVLIFRDANMAGHDYLVTGRGALTANTQWWFQTTGATVSFVRRPSLDDLHHTLRVGIVAGGERVAKVRQQVERTLGDRVLVQNFEAVQGTNTSDPMHVLEMFARAWTSGVDSTG